MSSKVVIPSWFRACALVGASACALVACGNDAADSPGGAGASNQAGATGAGAPGSAGAVSSSAGSTAAGAAGAATAGASSSAGSSSGGASGASGATGSAGSAGASGGSGGSGGSAGAASGGAGGGGGGGTGSCVTAPGKALQFDGSVVDLMSGDLGTDFPGGDVPRTIELWAKFLGSQSWKAEGSMLETGLAQGGGNRVLGIDLSGYSGMTAEFGPYTNGFSDNNHPNGVMVPNTPETGWLHLSWSYTGNHGTLTFTVNGTEYPIKTQGGTPTLNFTPGIVTLGGSQNFGTQGWSGVMDELRLWSVAKTPAQIKADMNVVSKGTEAGLVAYYRFDEGSGEFTDDVSKKASHRLTTCTATSMRCAAVNAAKPKWVDSDVPGPFTCAP